MVSCASDADKRERQRAFGKLIISSAVGNETIKLHAWDRNQERVIFNESWTLEGPGLFGGIQINWLNIDIQSRTQDHPVTFTLSIDNPATGQARVTWTFHQRDVLYALREITIYESGGVAIRTDEQVQHR